MKSKEPIACLSKYVSKPTLTNLKNDVNFRICKHQKRFIDFFFKKYFAKLRAFTTILQVFATFLYSFNFYFIFSTLVNLMNTKSLEGNQICGRLVEETTNFLTSKWDVFFVRSLM